jgi:hypothetical protein
MTFAATEHQPGPAPVEDKPLSTQDLAIAPELASHLVDPTAYADERLHNTYTWLRANNLWAGPIFQGLSRSGW